VEERSVSPNFVIEKDMVCTDGYGSDPCASCPDFGFSAQDFFLETRTYADDILDFERIDNL